VSLGFLKLNWYGVAMRKVIKRIPGAIFVYTQVRRFMMRTDPNPTHQQLQRIIVNQYKDSLERGITSYEKIGEAGFRCYSQFEEDGIILYVLSMIGMKTKRVVELSCGDGTECMSTNLILNHGYSGFLFEGNPKRASKALKFFAAQKDCIANIPIIQQTWVTRENINNLLLEIGAVGEVDLLSLDIDGNDYWIWEAITEISPRLCVFETHNLIPGDLSLSIPYEPNFNAWIKDGDEQYFRSASLLAMKKLSESKGYRMIGAHKHGFNVFFLRNDIAPEIFPEVSIQAIHDNPTTINGQRDMWPRIKDYPWLEV